METTSPHAPTVQSTTSASFRVESLPDTNFGGRVRFEDGADLHRILGRLEGSSDALPAALHAAHGLLVLNDMRAIRDDPHLLVRLSRLFGSEVENYRETQAPASKIHEQVPEIFLVSNLPPTLQQPPARPEPPFNPDGSLPVQFPHRRGWHTDQSYRRPPPDVSLFYAVLPSPPGQGQTLYSDGAGAYDALPDVMRQRIDGMMAIHVRPGTGRSEYAVRAGDIPEVLGLNDQPQRQPLVRKHPVTGKRALYLCEAGQLDWLDGPVIGLEPGPDGEGAELIYTLMSHATSPQFTYTHEWEANDLVIYDNRCTLHCATWFDAQRHERLMWRTTTRGNPGPEYAGERQSWRL